jgi:hypothetical protein
MKKQPASTESLNKIQKFYIAHHKSRDIKTLAADVGSTVKLVRGFLQSLEKREAKKIAEAEKAEANKPPDPGVRPIKIDDLMMKNKKRGAVVMTQAASEMGDETRKSRMSPRLSQNVQKIRPE